MRGSGVEPYEKNRCALLVVWHMCISCQPQDHRIVCSGEKYDNHYYYYCTSSNLKVEKIGTQHQLCATLKVIASPNAYT